MRSIDYFDRGHDLNPGRLAIIDGDSQYSFADVKTMTERIAVAMLRDGFRSQDTVAMYAPNAASTMIALLAIWRANGKWVPVNTRNAIDANIAYMNYVRCSWLFYHSSLATDVAMLQAAVPSLKHLVCLDTAAADAPSLAQFIEGTDPHACPDVCDAFGNLDDVVGIFPTGGTTGPSKGVIITNLGWGTMIETVASGLSERTDDPVSLVVAPITHAALPVALSTMSFGATQIILPGFDTDHVLETIDRHKVTHMYLPPTALYGMLGSPNIGKHDMSSLKIFILVGAPVSPEKLRRAVDVFGPCMCQAYGQVECPMIATWLPPEIVARAAAGDHPERLASCGKPTASIRLGIMDDEGNLLPNGTAGEIVMRGALISKEYFKKPEATEEARKFGWHHTGDIAYRDDQGYIYIVDRKKDMVVTGGFNVFTAEVEAAITELDAVAECAVIGIPDEKWGEAVFAFVVKHSAVDENFIIAHAKARLGSVKAPKSVSFVDLIPRTPNGKMDKKLLRSSFWGDNSRMVN